MHGDFLFLSALAFLDLVFVAFFVIKEIQLDRAERHAARPGPPAERWIVALDVAPGSTPTSILLADAQRFFRVQRSKRRA